MPDLPSPIFISYSHQDAKLVRPIVRLLRATKDLVFQDTDSIRPGRKWRPQIEKTLIEAKLIILFWCKHSIKSEEVKKEYKYALESKKDVLPLLLDKSELPDELGEFECVDFRKLSRYNHKSGWAWIRAISVSLIITFVGIFIISKGFHNLSYVDSPAYPPAMRAGRWDLLFAGLVIIIVPSVFCMAIYFLVRYIRRKQSNKQMAQGMYEEIIKRKHENLIKD